MSNNNPFAIISPEDLNAKQADQLFVELYSHFPEITREGNSLIMGARGCGKSMMIRCSLPDVLMLRKELEFNKLPYLAFCVPVKKTSLNLQELQNLNNCHAPYMLNEHFMIVHILMHIFLQLSEIKYEDDLYEKQIYNEFAEDVFIKKLKNAGYRQELKINYENPSNFFKCLYNCMDDMIDDFIQYLRGLLSITQVDYSYNLPILSFTRFLIPVLKAMMKLPGFPNNSPVFLFIDDADNLSKIQTNILNTWLASRTQPLVSLKISSQIGMYKSFFTSNGVLVEAPHDYQQVNIDVSYLLTNQSSLFYKNAVEILQRRLKLAEIDVEATDFFPPNKQQEEKIREEEIKIRNNYEENGRGYRESDDVRRYAIPNYIKNLGGTKKSRHTYQYAGLDNIIHLSSGIIRYLLDATAKMYDESAHKIAKTGTIKAIEPSIQNQVVRKKADSYLFNEIRKGDIGDSDDASIAIKENPDNLVDKLANLINAMGKTFHQILISDRAERKVFSVALSNIPDDEIKQVFELGVRLGFFHMSYIGNKEGDGRTYLYVLNRCFAPIFTLDPTGFQGYLFMTNVDLKKAINSGKQLRNILQEDESEMRQLTLEDFWED